MTLHKLALLLMSVLLMQAAVAQDLPAKKDSIYSNILHEQRMLIPPSKAKITATTYSYYDLTDSAPRKPVKTGILDPSFKWMNTELKNYECVIEGPVMIPEKSYYVLQLDEGEGSEIYINDTLLIKQPAGGKRQSIILPLDKGIYVLKTKLRPKAQFTVFVSEDGQDEWWKNQVYKE